MTGPIRKLDVSLIKNVVSGNSSKKNSENCGKKKHLASQEVQGFMGCEAPDEGPNSLWQNPAKREVLSIEDVYTQNYTNGKMIPRLKKRIKIITRSIKNRFSVGEKKNRLNVLNSEVKSVSIKERCEDIFASSPATLSMIVKIENELNKYRVDLNNVREKFSGLTHKNKIKLIKEINLYLRVLEKRKASMLTLGSLLRAKYNKVEVVKKYLYDQKKQGLINERSEFFISWLSKYQRGISAKLLDSSLCNQPVLEQDKKTVKKFYKGVEKIAKRLSLRVTAKDLIGKEVSLLEKGKVSIIQKEIKLYKDGGFHVFVQHSIPASSIQSDPKIKGEYDMFPVDYDGGFISSYSKTNIDHATNLFVSKLSVKREGNQPVSQIVRHGILSPYGLPKDCIERKKGARARVEEVIIASLSTKPELLKVAMQGKVPSLTLVSTSLVTPDSLRKYLGQQAEKEMLQDQIDAYKQVQNQKPLKLQIKLPNGNFKTIKLDVNIIPFNLGVNSYAVNSHLNSIAGGWSVSDRINSSSLNLLLGSLGHNKIGGLAGEFLRQYPNHPNKITIIELIMQIKDIYINKAHHRNEGGAHKLNSRISVLAECLGFVPTINCKSGKDRTGLAVAVTEALVADILLNKRVPDWKTVDQTSQYLVQEFATQGGHHDIQTLNTGVPGFKCQKYILEKYMPNVHVQDFIKGLA